MNNLEDENNEHENEESLFIKDEVDDTGDEFIENHPTELFKTVEELPAIDIKSEDDPVLEENFNDGVGKEVGNKENVAQEDLTNLVESENREQVNGQNVDQQGSEIFENALPQNDGLEEDSILYLPASKSSMESITTPDGKKYEVIPEFDVEAYVDIQCKIVGNIVHCLRCDSKLKNISFAKKHALVHSKRKLFKCPLKCGYESNYSQYLGMHLMMKHSSRENFENLDDDISNNTVEKGSGINEDDNSVSNENLSPNKPAMIVVDTSSDVEGGKRYEIKPEFDLATFADAAIKAVDDSYQCLVCDKMVNDLGKARRHALVHAEKKLLKCPENCSYETQYIHVLRTHLINRHGGGVQSPSEASDEDTNEDDTMIIVDLGKGGGKKYKVMPAFDVTEFLDATIKAVDGYYECLMCDKTFKYFVHAKQHVLKHSEKKLLKCPENCGYETQYISMLRTHLRNRHSGGAESTSEASDEEDEITSEFDIDDFFCSKFKKLEEEFVCMICDYKTSSVVSGKLHSLSHSKESLFKCPKECNFKTNDNKALESHLKNRHGMTCVVPNVIGDRAKNKNIIYKLKRIEKSSNIPMKISRTSLENVIEKDKTTTLGSNVIKETGKKVFECLECNYRTNKEDQYKSHVLLGTGFKWIKCEQCYYKTNQEMDLKEHMKTSHNV